MNGYDSSDDFDDALALANSTSAPHPTPPLAVPRPHRPAGRPAATSWAAARDTARHAVRAGEAVALPLHRAIGHSLAAPLVARVDLPALDTSAMDGWAVAGPGPWTLVDGGEHGRGVLAGDRGMSPTALPDGYAVPIATGARVPPGATAVLRSEHGSVDDDRLTAHRPDPQTRTSRTGRTSRTERAAQRAEVGDRTDIRPRGQECRTGDLLLPAGSRVTPAALGLAAAAGYDELTVTRRPRVEVLVLGAELTQAGVPAPGLLRDALGPLLDPWLTALGADVVAVRHLGDDVAALERAVDAADADVIVTTGGTAAGPVDHVRPLLARRGARLLVDSVAVRPGHPMLLAALPLAADDVGGTDATGATDEDLTSEDVPGGDDTGGARTTPRHLIGLPGNPLAAVSGLLTLAEPLLRALADHEPDAEPPTAQLTESVTGHPTDTRLVPVAEAARGVRPLRFHGPAMLRGIAAASALAVIPPGGSAPGSTVALLRLPGA